MKAMAAWFGLATSVAVEVQICTLCRLTLELSCGEAVNSNAVLGGGTSGGIMTTTTVERNTETRSVPAAPRLYLVWIDTNMGYAVPDWEINSAAKTYELAEQEASECLARGFFSLILPAGQTPRSDGLFSNPATDPN